MESHPSAGRRRAGRLRRTLSTPLVFIISTCSMLPRGAALTALLVMGALCPGCGNREETDKVAAVEARMEQLERRLAQVEAAETKIALLETQFTRLQESLEEMNRLVVLMTEVQDEPAARRPSSPKGRYHTVRRGDSLYVIARRYGTTVGELMRLNNLSRGRLIHPGQRLRVSE